MCVAVEIIAEKLERNNKKNSYCIIRDLSVASADTSHMIYVYRIGHRAAPEQMGASTHIEISGTIYVRYATYCTCCEDR